MSKGERERENLLLPLDANLLTGNLTRGSGGREGGFRVGKERGVLSSFVGHGLERRKWGSLKHIFNGLEDNLDVDPKGRKERGQVE